MIESSNKSLNHYTFASTMRKSPQSRKKHIVTVFATICWFHELRLHLNAPTVPALQRIIEPFPHGTYEQKKNLCRRWCDYRGGRRTPTEAVVVLAEAHCPGAYQILESPLWEALRNDRPAEKAALALMGSTSSLGDDLLVKALAMKNQHKGIDNRSLRKRCDAMVREASLEGLGVLTVCMRLAGEVGYDYLALWFYRSATRSLLILGEWMCERGIAQGLAEYYELVLLPICVKDAHLGTFNSGHYLRMVAGLQRMLQMKTEAKGEKLERDEAVAAMLELL